MNTVSRVIFVVSVLGAACDHKAMGHDSAGAHSAHGADGGDGAAGGADGGGADGACGGLVTGRATASGSCFGMEMQADLALDAATCTYTLSSWSMDHGDLPTGGQVVDGVATLEGGGLEGCTGEAAGGHLEGLCADGCAWVIDVG